MGLLAEHGEDAKVLAGGQSLIPMMSLRLAYPEALIDINAVEELDYVKRKRRRGGHRCTGEARDARDARPR